MIQCANISKYYASDCPVLQHINFHIAEGEMVFLAGVSGAGKTTLLKLMALQEPSHEGEIFINGQPTRALSRRRLALLKQRLGIVWDKPYLIENKTVFENVALPLHIAGYKRRDIARLVHTALIKVGISHKENMLPMLLSTVEKQRVVIARAIVREPAVVLADEPTGHLDLSSSKEIMQLFAQLNQLGLTIVIASHNLALLAQMKERVLVLRQGCLINGENDE